MPNRLRVIALAALTALAASHDVGAQARAPGWTLTMNMTIDSGNANRRVSIAVRQQVTARNLRSEYVQISGLATAGEAEGVYTILDDVDTTMTMVIPAQRTAMVTNPSAIIGGQMNMMPSAERHITSEKLEDLGPGERMLGHPTHHYRMTTVGTMDVTIIGETCSRPLDGVSEMWIAPDIDLADVMASVSKHFGTVYGMPDAKPVSASTSLPKGTSLRTIATTTGPDKSGRTVTVVTTTQYVELSQGPLDASRFAPPPDYKTMDMRKMMSDLPKGMLDSALKAGAEKGAGAQANALCHSGGPH